MKFIPMSKAKSGSLPTMEARRDSRFLVFKTNFCFVGSTAGKNGMDLYQMEFIPMSKAKSGSLRQKRRCKKSLFKFHCCYF